MKQSFLGLKTNKDAPSDAESVNARLLTQAGFIKKEMAGVYSYLPLGLRVLKKIENIITEEMESVGAQQISMPALTPLEPWKTTGRDGVDIAFHPTKKTVLAWSHEEIVTPIARDILRSHKDFPLCLFQIQNKFRNEPRAKSGVLRGREFLMKDAYSFHKNEADLMEYYEKMANAYNRIYARCGLIAKKLESGGGEFSENISHEFSVASAAGEDAMVFCGACDFAQNTEMASAISPPFNFSSSEKEMKIFDNERANDILATAKALGLKNGHILKTVVFVQKNGELIGVALRGDLSVSADKVGAFLKTEVRPATPTELEKNGLVIGFISPVYNTTICFLIDESATKNIPFYTGANVKNRDYKNAVFGRDFSGDRGNFALVTAGFLCPKCGHILREEKCIEVGNIFNLGTKYSEAFRFTFTDADGKQKPVFMGCYGIGVTRLLGTVAEVLSDENGLVWPASLSPFSVHILSLNENARAAEIAFELEQDGFEVLFDDRDERPGKKFADSDLLGIPLRLVVSKRGLEKNVVEMKNRATGKVQEISLSEIPKAVWTFFEA